MASLYNLSGAYTYTKVAVLHGRWEGKELRWEMSDLVKADPERSTPGMDEATLAHLNDGRILMILRGSNDKHPELPGRRWTALSSDGGCRWTQPQPWTFEDGGDFFSP